MKKIRCLYLQKKMSPFHMGGSIKHFFFRFSVMISHVLENKQTIKLNQLNYKPSLAPIEHDPCDVVA